MITIDIVKSSYAAGHIYLVVLPGDGVACKIGDGQFFFGGNTAESYDSVESYKEEIPAECIVSDIFESLQSFWACGRQECKDEYFYYERYLREKGNAEISSIA